MFESIFTSLGAAKAKAVEAGARAFLDQKIGKFGSVTQLQIDPERRIIHLAVMLKGEVAPVEVRLLGYDVAQRDDGTYFSVQRVEASREWLSAAANEYLVGKSFKVPEAFKFAV